MTKRFPHYRPSTALRQAIEALRAAKSARAAGLGRSTPEKKVRAAAMEGGGVPIAAPGQFDQGETPGGQNITPGREGTNFAVGLGQSHKEAKTGTQDDALPGADALTSGRRTDES